VPIIALTADAMDDDREKMLKAGMNDHAAKPIKPKQLFSLIERFLKPPEDRPEPEVPPEPEVAPDNVLDQEVLTEVQEVYVNNEAGFENFVRLFLENASEKIAALKAAMAENDFQTVRETAHSLKSCSAFIGAMAMSEVCRQAEAMIIDGRANDALGDVVDRAGREFERVKQVLATIVPEVPEGTVRAISR
jgi:HPt (histidine-containing phosphotransfer) domain-containing protein